MPLEEIKRLTKIHLQVDLSNSHLTHVGQIMESLIHLNLNDSIIPEIWNLGTSFWNIQVLWIARSELKELSGFCALDNLKELYCSYNEIYSLNGLMYLDKLEVLDLEANWISKFDELNTLKFVSSLKHINLDLNPISYEWNYRKRVMRMLEQLETIDDYDIKALESQKVKPCDITAVL